MATLDGAPEVGTTGLPPGRFSFRDRGARASMPPPAASRPAGGDDRGGVAVLVVDDDVEMLAALRDMLARGRHRIDTASDGEEALRRFADAAFDVVVTDLAMPRMDGLQLARRCRCVRPGVPVVVVTAWDGLVSDADMEENGVARVLAKPVRAAVLLDAVAEVTGRG